MTKQFNPECADCLGTGKIPDDDGSTTTCTDCPPLCATCDDEGRVTQAHWSNDPQREKEVPCPDCTGAADTKGDGLADHKHDQWKERRLEASR